jgi:hypothetical protein
MRPLPRSSQDNQSLIVEDDKDIATFSPEARAISRREVGEADYEQLQTYLSL